MFEVTKYEHPDIFVRSRRTGETYWFIVGDDGTVTHDEAGFDQGDAHRMAIAYLAQIARPNEGELVSPELKIGPFADLATRYPCLIDGHF
jgi:hypothetical protein